ncbi:60S ribosomal protein L6 [Diplonema papillatum]|nr:60S ribosomal protein L6 [Diplonema papillatum]
MPKAGKLRSSLEDEKSVKVGTVLILLAGRFRGRRVVLLKKEKKTGTLVVTGPYKINGVPLRRVDPAYVIATSTKIDLGKINLAPVTEDFFARPKASKSKSEEAFFKKRNPSARENSSRKHNRNQQHSHPLNRNHRNSQPLVQQHRNSQMRNCERRHRISR